MKCLFVSIALLGAVMSAAQTNYYAGKKVVSGTNVKYNVKETEDYYDLSNVLNTKTYKPFLYWDGTQPDPLTQGIGFYFKNKNPGLHLLYGLFRETFSSADLDSLKRRKDIMLLGYIIELSGDVSEVLFCIKKDNPILCAIPPDVWYALEQKIKQYEKFIVPESSKVVQFLQGTTIVDFTKVPDSLPDKGL